MNVYEQYQPGGGVFLKLNANESAKLRIASEPYIFTNDFNGQLSTRYAWVVWNRELEQAQLLQQGITGYRTISNLAQDEEWGDPTKYDIKITREGTGMLTKYHIQATPNRDELTKEQKDDVAKVDVKKLIPNAILLEDVVDGKTPPPPPTSGGISDMSEEEFNKAFPADEGEAL